MDRIEAVERIEAEAGNWFRAKVWAVGVLIALILLLHLTCGLPAAGKFVRTLFTGESPQELTGLRERVREARDEATAARRAADAATARAAGCTAEAEALRARLRSGEDVADEYDRAWKADQRGQAEAVRAGDLARHLEDRARTADQRLVAAETSWAEADIRAVIDALGKR